MNPIDATKERFETVEIFGIPGLFTTLRVSRATVPKGMYAYDMQTDDTDWLQPHLLGRHVTVDHFGTVLTASPIDLPESGYRDLSPGDFDQGGGTEQLTVTEFEEKYLSPAAPPPKRTPPHSSARPRRLPVR